MSSIYLLVQQTMFFSIPLLIVALGGMFSEKSGVINIALEGIMIIGAFFGALFLNLVGVNMNINPQLLLIITIMVSIISGMLISSLLAFASINMKADQTIGGTALNLLAPALVVYIARMIYNVKQVPIANKFRIAKVPLLGDIPVIGNLFFQNTYLTTYIGILILIVSIIVLYKTRFGLRLSACGEHPQAAESVGVNVYHMRWAGVLISGALGGLGGLIYVIPTMVSFSGTVEGYGFLALAVTIFGQWKPKRILFAAFFFGFFKTISAMYSSIPIVKDINLPHASYIYKMLPYVATMFVLAFTSKKSRAPKAEGIPYDKGAR
ncbi:MAG: ABC transporter permease [Bacilli bacterium]|jgi:simple sugar transport system permease protein|nr:ABC transporter permease [Bacilli bacterium]HHU24757.1 ABC transporter permease [Acholeplasmataceae bacterium]